MCRLILTAGLCLIITTLASAAPTNQFCNGKSNGDYTNPENPNSFITCSNGLASVTNCQPGLVFSQSLDRCDWPPTTASTTTTRATSPTTTNQFCKDKRNGDYTNPANPNSFITCSNGLTYITDCQPGLVFSQSLDRCDWPPNTASTTTTRATSPTTTNQFCKDKRNGDYTNPANPNSFITCSNGLTYITDCQPGLVFSQSLDRCDWPPNTASTTTIRDSTTRATSPTTTNQFCKDKRNGDYTNPANPNSFITCSNGLTYITDCQPGLVFSQSLDRCDWPPNTASTTTTRATSPTTTNQFCKDKRNGDYTNPANPNSFITCSNGLTYITDCQPGLVFSQSLDRCDWPPNTASTTTIRDSTTRATSPTTTNQFCNGKSNGDYTNPENPNSFITCSNGLASVTNCQPGLVFSQSLDRCDWPPNTASTTTTRATSPTTTNQFCKDKRNGDYTNPANPNSFITCSNGLAYITYCQTGLIFNQRLDRCV